MSEWKFIKDAPKDGTAVLTYHEDCPEPLVSKYLSYGYGKPARWKGWAIEPTHFMFLPASPKDTNDLHTAVY